jgi:hypothetical protein
VGLDVVQDRQRNVEVVGAEQQPGWGGEALALEGAAQQNHPRRSQVVPVQP